MRSMSMLSRIPQMEYALVSKDGKYFYIDKDGQKRMALDPGYTDLHMHGIRPYSGCTEWSVCLSG